MSIDKVAESFGGNVNASDVRIIKGAPEPRFGTSLMQSTPVELPKF